MQNNYSVTGIHTGIIRPGDDIVTAILDAEETKDMGGLKEGDVIVIAESALATSESRLIKLGDVSPSDRAYALGRRNRNGPPGSRGRHQRKQQHRRGNSGLPALHEKRHPSSQCRSRRFQCSTGVPCPATRKP